MKRSKRNALLLTLIVLITSVAPLLGDSPSLPDEGSLSTCGVAYGFAAGAFLAATISAMTPGGQGAAAILAITAGAVRVGISILC